MTIGTFAYKFSGTSGSVTELRFVPTGYTPGAGEFVGTADALPNLNLVAIRTITDWYWIVNDTNPTTQVWSTASNAYVANSSAAFATWLTTNSTTSKPPGVAFPIHGMANNGAGLIRLTLGTTAAIQTGQKFNVGGQTGQAAASGNWVITVIDAAHVDLQGSTFNAGDPWITGGVLQGASIIDTDANLRIEINIATFPQRKSTSFLPGHTSLTFTTGVATLTHPLATVSTFDTSTAGSKIILPNMTDPTSPSIGDEIFFKNLAATPSSSQPVDIFLNDATTYLTTVSQGDIVSLALKSNATANGAWTVSVSQLGTSLGQHWGMSAIQGTAGTTQVVMNMAAAVVRDFNGIARYLRYNAGMTATLDISTTGPALNGRDAAGAFSAGNTIYVYLIWGLNKTPGYIASSAAINSAPQNGPVAFPSGYTHYCYVFTMVLDASAKVPVMCIGREGMLPPQGSTTVASAATCVIPANYDHVEISGTTNISTFDLSPSTAYGRMVSGTFTSGGGTLVNGVPLAVQGGANYTWAAGDTILIQGHDNTSFTRVSIFKADGTPVVGSSTIANDAVTAVTMAASGHGYAGGMVNGTFTVSAAASALTIALKTQAGTNPSATDPVDFFFRNATGTTGDYTRIRVTAATSLVISSGSTMGVTSSTAFRIWIVGFNDGGTFRLGAINCSTSTQIFPLVEGLASSTAEGGAGAADSAGVIYTGTAVTSKAMLILGYAEWNTSGLTAGTWTTTNLSVVQLFGPGVKKPGDVVQKVTNTAARTDTTTSATFVATGFSTSITPASAANLLEIMSTAPGYVNAAAASNALFKMSRGTTNNTNMIGSVTVMSSPAAGSNISQSVAYLLAYDLPNTTSAQSYAVQFSNNTGATTGYGNGNNATMVITELMG